MVTIKEGESDIVNGDSLFGSHSGYLLSADEIFYLTQRLAVLHKDEVISLQTPERRLIYEVRTRVDNKLVGFEDLDQIKRRLYTILAGFFDSHLDSDLSKIVFSAQQLNRSLGPEYGVLVQNLFTLVGKYSEDFSSDANLKRLLDMH